MEKMVYLFYITQVTIFNSVMMKHLVIFSFVFLCVVLPGCGSSAKKDADKSSATENASAQKTAIITGDKINIREKPTIDSRVLGVLGLNEKVSVLETGIAGNAAEGSLNRNIDFYDAYTGDFSMTVNKGRAVKILSYDPDNTSYKVFLYLKKKKVNAVVKAADISLIGNENWVKLETARGVTGYCLQKYVFVSEPELQAENTRKRNKVSEEIYESNDLGYTEYMKRIHYSDGEYDWYYYTKKNPKAVKLGIVYTSYGEGVFFHKKPEVIYEIGYSECGFSVIDPKGVYQWYQQTSPVCH